jgi:hypothetical protein
VFVKRYRFAALIAVATLSLGLIQAAERRIATTAVTKPLAEPAAAPTDRFERPVPMGVSVGNTPSLPFIYAGTAGLLVQEVNAPSIKYILSNNHVLGVQGPTLCPGTAQPGIFTLQPGTLDIGNDPGNSSFYQVGNFARSVPLVRGLLARNRADAAISVTTLELAKSEILGIGEPTIGTVNPVPGMPVIKSGRTTGVTNGTVDAVNVTLRVNYGTGCGRYRFIRQTTIVPGTFSSSGDSGSAILEAATNTPAALLFAGSSSLTVGTPIDDVFDLLGVEMSGSTPGQRRAMRANRLRDPEMSRLEAIQARHEDRLLDFDGVEGIGIGREGSRLVFKVYVTRLTPALRTALPRDLEGIPVVISESGEITAR